MNNTAIHQYLQDFDIRPSVQRTAVMKYLMEHHTHPTIDEIFGDLSPQMPTLSRTTIYNTLDLFIKRGAVTELNIDEKNARYDSELKPHGHFMCKKCGKIFDVYDLQPSMFTFPVDRNFEVTSVEIAYSGVCSACKESTT